MSQKLFIKIYHEEKLRYFVNNEFLLSAKKYSS